MLSVGSDAQALADQGAIIDQGITGDATAHPPRTAPSTRPGRTPRRRRRTADPDRRRLPTAAPAATAASAARRRRRRRPGRCAARRRRLGAAAPLDGNLLNVDVNLDADADLAAPIDGAVAANANVAAPIDAAVGANIGSIDSDAIAVAQQDAIITQDIHGDATATADQQSDLKQ